jgi:putative ABC transport system substrate-binding protein
MPVIGLVTLEPLDLQASRLDAFRQGLRQTGFIEHQNVAIEYRSADGQPDRLPGLVADLVDRRVTVIVSLGGVRSALAAKAATTSIPIVFNTGGDPVQLGLAASLNRPGGNLTGATTLSNELAGKQLQEIRDLLPDVNAVGFLLKPDNLNTEVELQQLRVAAQKLGFRLEAFSVQQQSEFVGRVAGSGIGALLIQTEPMFNLRVEELAALAARYSIPAIHSQREFALAGGLMSYGAEVMELFHYIGVYSGRILKGARPTDLPIVQPTKFELILNLKTAKALGLTVPPTLLAIADDVIE